MRSIIHQTGRKGSYLEWNLRFINNYSQKLARNGAEKKSRRGTFSWAKETSWQALLIFFLILLFYSTVAVRPISHKRRTAWRNRLDENRKSFVQKKLYVRNENTRQSVPIVHFVLVFLLQIARFKWVDGNTSTIPPQSFYYQPCPGGVSCSVRCGFRSCIYTTLVSGGLCLLAMALPSAESWFHQSWFKWKRWRIKARYYRVSTKIVHLPRPDPGEREKKFGVWTDWVVWGKKKSALVRICYLFVLFWLVFPTSWVTTAREILSQSWRAKRTKWNRDHHKEKYIEWNISPFSLSLLFVLFIWWKTQWGLCS